MVTPTQKLGYEIRNARKAITTGMGYVDLPDMVKEKVRGLLAEMDAAASLVLDYAKEQADE